MRTNLAVKIVRYVDDHQPGWVEVEFVDAQEHRHTFVDKVPGFTRLPLDAHSSYPQPGQVSCEVLSQSQAALGRTLVSITTARPYHIESTEGVSEFIVLQSQLSP
jgi:hypothetical protein